MAEILVQVKIRVLTLTILSGASVPPQRVTGICQIRRTISAFSAQ
jgi:hypothetical protein